MTTHQNLPALNKYTSLRQYEALSVVRDTKSIVELVHKGSSSKTLGSLLRSMWIVARVYVDEAGVTREGWFVTPDGEHAMKMYEKRREDQEQQEQKEQQIAEELFIVALKYWAARDKYETMARQAFEAERAMKAHEQEFELDGRVSFYRRKEIGEAAKVHYYRLKQEKIDECKRNDV